jgi:hypothetical protein
MCRSSYCFPRSTHCACGKPGDCSGELACAKTTTKSISRGLVRSFPRAAMSRSALPFSSSGKMVKVIWVLGYQITKFPDLLNPPSPPPSFIPPDPSHPNLAWVSAILIPIALPFSVSPCWMSWTCHAERSRGICLSDQQVPRSPNHPIRRSPVIHSTRSQSSQFGVGFSGLPSQFGLAVLRGSVPPW